MLLSDGCIEDMNSLLMTTMVTDLSTIVGYDLDGNPLKSVKIIDKRLQKGDNLLYSVCHELSVYLGIQKEQEVKSGTLFMYRYESMYFDMYNLTYVCVYRYMNVCLHIHIQIYTCFFNQISIYTCSSC